MGQKLQKDPLHEMFIREERKIADMGVRGNKQGGIFGYFFWIAERLAVVGKLQLY